MSVFVCFKQPTFSRDLFNLKMAETIEPSYRNNKSQYLPLAGTTSMIPFIYIDVGKENKYKYSQHVP